MNLKTAHDSFKPWREGVHDDLVLCVAIACWTATQRYSDAETRVYSQDIQKQLDRELESIMGPGFLS